MKKLKVTIMNKSFSKLSVEVMAIEAAAEIYPVIEALEDSLALYESFNLEIVVDGLDTIFQFELVEKQQKYYPNGVWAK